MKLSNTTLEELATLTPHQKWTVICGGIEDKGETADIALLLGSRPCWSGPRARAAAKLYREGRVSYIVPSGGVEWDTDGEMLSEAYYMKRVLMEEGVPEEAIILENEATTTKENMIYGTLQINRRFKFYKEKKIMIVTSINHMKRSMALAKTFLPRMAEISYYPSEPDVSYEECMKDADILDRAIYLMKGLVDHGIVDDVEIDLG